ncbi:MAG: GAF domain-containing protein [Anaerolineae bacterium]|nr:GAF domain-containing protein [Anaerolineae bacterium]
MDEERKQKHLESVDEVLAAVREDLKYTRETGDVYELRALQLLLQVTKAMHSEHDIYALMAMILDSALSFASANRAFLMLLDDKGNPRFKMGRSYDGANLSQSDFVISTSVVEQALLAQSPFILADAQLDEEFSKRDSILELDLRTVMAAPLRYEDHVLGLIYVDSNRPLTRYSKHHMNVLTSLSDQAAVAILNAQKFETQSG